MTKTSNQQITEKAINTIMAISALSVVTYSFIATVQILSLTANLNLGL